VVRRPGDAVRVDTPSHGVDGTGGYRECEGAGGAGRGVAVATLVEDSYRLIAPKCLAEALAGTNQI